MGFVLTISVLTGFLGNVRLRYIIVIIENGVMQLGGEKGVGGQCKWNSVSVNFWFLFPLRQLCSNFLCRSSPLSSAVSTRLTQIEAGLKRMEETSKEWRIFFSLLKEPRKSHTSAENTFENIVLTVVSYCCDPAIRWNWSCEKKP